MPISEWVKNIRDIIGHELIVMVGAAAIVVNDKEQILIQQRTDSDYWGLPGGGIEPGEEPAEAAIREVYEETGLVVEVTNLVGIFGGKEQVGVYANGDKFAYVSVTFECRVVGGVIQPDREESKDVRWFAPENLPSPFVPVHLRRISAWQSKQMPYFAVPEIDIIHMASSNYIKNIRQRIGNLLLITPGCDVLVFNDKGDVLVQKRQDDGQWNLPGGMYEPGEEPAQTAIREVYEETGLIVQPRRLVGVYGGETFIHTYPNGDVIAFINIVFVCEIVGGRLQRQSDESLDLCFVAPNKLPEPFLDIHRSLIDHALNRTEPYFAR